MRPKQLRQQHEFVVCISNDGYAASLELRKVYQTLADPEGSAHGLVRVIDESGDDYLYSADLFEPIAFAGVLRTKRMRDVFAALQHSKRKAGPAGRIAVQEGQREGAERRPNRSSSARARSKELRHNR